MVQGMQRRSGELEHVVLGVDSAARALLLRPGSLLPWELALSQNIEEHRSSQPVPHRSSTELSSLPSFLPFPRPQLLDCSGSPSSSISFVCAEIAEESVSDYVLGPINPD